MNEAASQALERVSAFIQRLEGIEFRIPEDEAAVARGALFAPRLAKEIETAIDLLRRIEEVYDRMESDGSPEGATDSLSDIGKLISSEIASQEVSDLLFLARGELRNALQDLMASIDQEDFLRVASSCDSGLRALKRTLISVEYALCEYDGQEPPPRHWTDLEVSLRTRRLYGALRRDVLKMGNPGDAVLAVWLAEVGKRFAELKELDFYPLLRFDDRVTLRDLQDRVRTWQSNGALDLDRGRRLWQDIVGFCELIKEVSHRQELRQHDRSLVRRAYNQLFGRPSFPEAVADLSYQLSSLLGLDDELDELLLRQEREDLESWRKTLSRLLHRLSLGAEAVP